MNNKNTVILASFITHTYFHEILDKNYMPDSLPYK